MKLSTRNIVLVVAGLLAVALLAAWWSYNYEYVVREVDLPPRGEAAYNPLYALKLALLADGVQVLSRQRLQIDDVPLGTHDTVLVFNDPRTLSQHDVDTLLQWVQGGGHLLVRTPPMEKLLNGGVLLDKLAMQVRPRARCEKTSAGLSVAPLAVTQVLAKTRTRAGVDDWQQSLFCSGARFTMMGVEPVHSWSDLDIGYVYARFNRGFGTVDVVADFDFLRNDRFDYTSNQALARQLLQPGWRQGTVHLVYAASMPPLWKLLFDKAWMAWLPLLLALGAWLWMRTQRFGPRLPSPEPARRALLEHVQASGEHLWRYGRAATLYMAVRETFLARLRRRDPLAAALDGAAQADAIAARTGASAAEVAHALQTPKPGDGHDFRFRIARLLQLRQRL